MNNGTKKRQRGYSLKRFCISGKRARFADEWFRAETSTWKFARAVSETCAINAQSRDGKCSKWKMKTKKQKRFHFVVSVFVG